jgi:Phage tail tube protein
MLRFLRITQEAAFGVFPTASPVSIFVRLSGDNAFTPMTDPEFFTVMDGSGLGVPALFGSATSSNTSTLTTEVTYSQAAFLLGWALQRLNTAQTEPWTTTELPNDLASCTLDFAWSQFDTTTLKTKRYLGAKVASLNLAGSKDSPKVMATFALVASTPQGNTFDGSTDPTLTAPAPTVYPTDVAVFQHLKGNVTIDSVARSNFESFNLSVQNVLVPYWDESRFPNAIRLGGRTVTASAKWRLKSSVTDRTSYESNATQSALFEFVNPGASHSISLNFNTNGYISAYKEDLQLQREVYYTWTLASYLDTTAGSDLTLTVT